MKNINSILNKEVATLAGEKELCKELDKFQGKNVIISVHGGFSGVIFLNNFNYGIRYNRDMKEYLSLETENPDEVNYTIDLNEIESIQPDPFLFQSFINLQNKQTIQIWCEEDFEN